MIGRRGVLLEVALGRKPFKPTGNTLDCCLAGMGFCRMWGLGGSYLSQQVSTLDLIGIHGIHEEGAWEVAIYAPRETPLI